MTTYHHLFKLIIVALFTTASLAFTQTAADAVRIGENQIGFGARALGMGGAYRAVADDYSAIYWNPAGLAQMPKMEFWMELSHTDFENDIIFQNEPSSATNSATKFSGLGLVFPVPTYRGSLVFALGYQRVKSFEYANQFRGISSVFSEAGANRLTFLLDESGKEYNFWGEAVEKQEILSDEGNINQWSAAGAIDVSPNISVGLGLNFWTGSSDYRQEFTQTDVFNNFDAFPANFFDYQEDNTIMTDYSAFSFKLSGLFRAGSFARFGAGLELPKTFNVEEDWRTESSVSFDTSEVGNIEEVIFFSDEEGTFEYDVKYPFKFFGGASVALGPVLLSASAEYMDWTQIEFDIPSDAELDENFSALLDENKFFQTDYHATVKLNFGGEVGLPFLDSQLRAGYIIDPSPREKATSENDRKFFTLGYGLLIDRIFKVDIAYLRGGWEQTTFDNFTPTGSKEDITYQKLFLTFAYRF